MAVTEGPVDDSSVPFQSIGDESRKSVISFGTTIDDDSDSDETVKTMHTMADDTNTTKVNMLFLLLLDLLDFGVPADNLSLLRCCCCRRDEEDVDGVIVLSLVITVTAIPMY